ADEHHGLGLAIVAAVARMHAGHPVARSEDGVTSIGVVLSTNR
ncbi:MAG: two-component sensor histidine kinase, partial [Burkholderiaceae bacterium]